MSRNETVVEVEKCRSDLEYFASKYLKILDKKGSIVPLKFNTAQKILHGILEERIKEAGYLRALVLKGRQEGVSTYIAARFYWKSIFNVGVQTIILTHETQATNNLFEMVNRFHRLMPDNMKPSLGKANAKMLQFRGLESGYKVATAGTKGAGRSATAQLFHGSEVAFWANPAEHMAGIGQTIPDLAGTEIIHETTGNGLNFFHNMWKSAIDKKSSYIPVFLAWYLDSGYKKYGDYVPEDDAEIEYQDTYKLSNEQMLWRRNKINTDFKGDVSLFNQEYPASPLLAFYRKDTLSFITPSSIDKCNSMSMPDVGALVMGIDCSEFGDDSNAVVFRKGRFVDKPVLWGNCDIMETAGRCAKLIQERNPEAVMVLATGIGAGLWARLKEMFPSRTIYRIMEGESAIDQEVFANKRAEMWSLMRDLIIEGCQLPKDEGLNEDLSAPYYHYDSKRRLRIESKENMKSRGAHSPDRADALAATFAYAVETKESKISRMVKRFMKTHHPLAS
jgi:hypothetical protein